MNNSYFSTEIFCRWCQNHNGKTDLSFAVVDDDYPHHIPERLIKFCPFCGRELEERQK